MRYKPERDVIKAWRLKRLILLTITAILFFVLLAMALMKGENLYIGLCAAIGVLFLYKLVGIIVYPLIEYKQWEYMITEEKIEIVHGIFFINRDIIPMIRIQNITLEQGPIFRQFGLHNVEIALASGSFEIVGLTLERAEEIADSIRKKLYAEHASKEEVK